MVLGVPQSRTSIPIPSVPAPHGAGGRWVQWAGVRREAARLGDPVGAPQPKPSAHHPNTGSGTPGQFGHGLGQTGGGRTERIKQSGVSNSRPLVCLFFYSFFIAFFVLFFVFFFLSIFTLFSPHVYTDRHREVC